MSFNTRNH